MLCTYVHTSKARGLLPTLGGFEEWLAEQEDPNITFCRTYVLQYLLGLLLFREGVRTADSSKLHAGLAAVSPVFYLMHMPFYQDLYYRHRCILACAPPPVAEMLHANVSFTENGQANKQEGEHCSRAR